MKKLFAVLLSAAMLVSMAGCGAGTDGKALYDEATKKNAELTSMDFTYHVDMVMKQGDQSMDMSTDMDMKMDGINTDSMRMISEGTTSTAGQNVDTFMYYENGYCYMETGGQKFKYAMAIEEMSKAALQSVGGANMESSYMQKVEVKKDGDNQVLTFVGDASKMDEYVQTMMGAMGTMGTGMEGLSYTIKEVSGEATVNSDGYISSMKMKMVIEMTMQGETVSVDMDITGDYHNLGQPVEITAPADLDSYQEIDASQLGL